MANRDVPVWEKSYLTIEEAAEYSGISIKELWQLTKNDERCLLVFVGGKRLFVRKNLDEAIVQSKKEIPIWQKKTLTVEEASAYSGIGMNTIRRLSDSDRCDFVLWIGTKRMIKRKEFDEFISKAYSI